MPAPPDPMTPGLLDLLTVAGIGGPLVDDPDAPASPPRPRSAVATAGGSRRLWVEVEA